MAPADTATTLVDTAASKEGGEKSKGKGTAKSKGKAKGKATGKGKAKGKGKGKGKAKAKPKTSPTPLGVDGSRGQAILPPFKLHHRWRPADQAQCYMAGAVDGAPKKFITNVSVRMSVCFCNIMADLLKEVNAGAFQQKARQSTAGTNFWRR